MRIIFICLFGAVSGIVAAQQVITGRITDASDGQPLPNANIFIANTTIGSVSDESGNYTVTIPGMGSYEIVVSYVGFQTVFYKIEEPESFHQIDFALEIKELPEVVVTVSKVRRKDVNLFWRTLLGATPSNRGLEVLNPGSVNYYLNSDNILNVWCDEPIRIINHEMGYHIRYELEHFQYDYRTDVYLLRGSPQFEELTPTNYNQKNRWEKKRKEVYSVSITRFIRALYRQQLLENGFLLTKNILRKTFSPLMEVSQSGQEWIQVSIDSPLYLGCLSSPITSLMIDGCYDQMFDSRETFPVLILLPQQIYIYADGTYSGILNIKESRNRNRISGLSARLPIHYMYNEE